MHYPIVLKKDNRVIVVHIRYYTQQPKITKHELKQKKTKLLIGQI